MSEEQKYIDFETYKRFPEPLRQEKTLAWRTAIGLQDVDGFRVSDYLKKPAIKHIEDDFIQHRKPSEIEQVFIPKLPKSIQETISAKIQESFALIGVSKCCWTKQNWRSKG